MDVNAPLRKKSIEVLQVLRSEVESMPEEGHGRDGDDDKSNYGDSEVERKEIWNKEACTCIATDKVA